MVSADSCGGARGGEGMLLCVLGLHRGGAVQPFWVAGGAVCHGPGQRAAASLLPGRCLRLGWRSGRLDPVVSAHAILFQSISTLLHRVSLARSTVRVSQ